jgi:hypothetical protein
MNGCTSQFPYERQHLTLLMSESTFALDPIPEGNAAFPNAAPIEHESPSLMPRGRPESRWPRPSAQEPLEPDSFVLEQFTEAQQRRLRGVLTDLDFIQAQTRREQIAIACKHLRTFEGFDRFTFDAIGRFFGGLKGATIEQQFRLSQQPFREPGRPPILTAEVRQWVTQLINDRFHAHQPITYAEILDLLQYHHSTVLSSESLRHIIRNMPSVKSAIGIPTEAERVSVDPTAIDQWYAELERRVTGIPRQFVFNVDETGCSDRSDSRETRVVVPADYPEPTVPVPVDRHTKRSTLTACIAADGFRMKPFVIVDRSTVEMEIQYYGYHQSNVFIASQENAFMTKALFELWAREIFFPTVIELREKWQYNGPALLLMDGLGSHHTDQFLSECQERGIDVLFLVPHA